MSRQARLALTLAEALILVLLGAAGLLAGWPTVVCMVVAFLAGDRQATAWWRDTRSNPSSTTSDPRR